MTSHSMEANRRQFSASPKAVLKDSGSTRRGLKQAVTASGADMIRTGEQGMSHAEAGTLLWLLQCLLQLGKHREREGRVAPTCGPRGIMPTRGKSCPPCTLGASPHLPRKIKQTRPELKSMLLASGTTIMRFSLSVTREFQSWDQRAHASEVNSKQLWAKANFHL